MHYIDMDNSSRCEIGGGSSCSSSVDPMGSSSRRRSMSSQHLRRRGDSASPLTVQDGYDDSFVGEEGYYPKSYSKDGGARIKWALLAVLAAASFLSVGFTGVSRSDQRKLILGGVRLPSKRKSRRIVRKIESGTVDREKTLTIRLSGHRIDLLQRSLEQHAKCDVVHEIQIDWNGRTLPDSMLNHFSNKVKPARTRLSTSAVLVLDEAILLRCQEIDRAFSEWRHDPVRLVGFSSLHASQQNSVLVSSKALVAHRLYLDSNNGAVTSTIFSASDSECDHFLFSARVAAMTRKSPNIVAARPKALAQVNMASSATCLPNLVQAVGEREEDVTEENDYENNNNNNIRTDNYTDMPNTIESGGYTYIGRM